MTADADGRIGRVLNGRYRLSRSLGRGGMGEVWLAVDTALGREVAIKELLLPATLDTSAQTVWLERSKREAIAAARIRHENVVTVHDVFEADGRPWIVMELIVSRSLAEVVRAEGRLEPAEAARVGLYVLRALRAAHAKGVVHRDVKPANVLLGLDGRVVLTDFGIATFAGGPRVTQHGELLGTPGYLAPERAGRFARSPAAEGGATGCEDGEELDPASDLWSLGATLYEIVEGVAPFKRPSAVEVVDAVVHQDPAPARYARELEPVVLGLLRKDPATRLDGKEAEALLSRIVQESVPVTWGGAALTLEEATADTGDLARRAAALREAGRVPEARRSVEGLSGVESTLAGHDGGGDVLVGRGRRWRRKAVLLPAACVLALLAIGVPWLVVGQDGSGRPANALKAALSEARHSSATYQAMLQRGYVIIGVKPDQPGLSEQFPDGSYAGFDDDIARMIAADLGFPATKIHFMNVETQGREYRISSGQVDMIVASYTIDADRLSQVSFAGPYFVAGQDFLVRSSDTSVNGPEDLANAKVCVVRESTSADRIAQKFPGMQVEQRGLYSECVDDLLAGTVRAVSTDDAILAGFVQQHPGQLRVLDHPFSEEPYGVGIQKGDTALARAICVSLTRHIANGDWQRAYNATLGPLGLPVPRPPACQVDTGG